MTLRISGRRLQKQTVVIIMSVTGCFLLLCLPYTIFIIFCIIFQKEINNESTEYKIMDVISLTNNSVNFFIYYLSGSKFRNEFMKIFCPWRAEASGVYNNNNNNTIANFNNSQGRPRIGTAREREMGR